ncbi:hypothetical protein ACFPM0_05335 [Pseudonocardia sulfidoxydans]|uniref:hypothetical protein n=1 Tax=Pseudonocardia sulfidoxydans TaxID=54011 RepID=UPI0036095BD3
MPPPGGRGRPSRRTALTHLPRRQVRPREWHPAPGRRHRPATGPAGEYGPHTAATGGSCAQSSAYAEHDSKDRGGGDGRGEVNGGAAP